MVFAVAIGCVGDRDIVASGGYDQTVRLWDAHARTGVHTLDTVAPVSAIALAPESAIYVASGPAICSLKHMAEAATI